MTAVASRTRRFVGGIGLGYLYLGLVTVVGLWLTPFLLGRIGQHDYGLWLVVTQIVGYLMLLDLGVVALLPREVAYASSTPTEDGAVATVVHRIRRLVRWQLPLVGIAALTVWLLVPAEWQALSGPLAGVLVVFVLLFPFRVFQAALQGLQDLEFLGWVQLVTWATSITATIALVVAGFGLYALVAGWAIVQCGTATASWWRLRTVHTEALSAPARDSSQPSTVSAGGTRGYVKQSGWISLEQVAQVFLSGSDVLVLAHLLGAAAVVPYACTAKLAIVFANHPYLLANTAVPALSQIRAGGDTSQLLQVSRALSQTVLMLSGLVACGILTANAWFVSWWVGPEQYGGLGLTLAVIAAMMLRHYSFTLAQVLFCLGRQRALSLTAIADGFSVVALTVALAPSLGIIAAPLAQILSVAIISIPVHLVLLGRELGRATAPLASSSLDLVRRLAVPMALAGGFAVLVSAPAFGAVTLALASVGLAFCAVMAPVALRPPLRPYLDRLASAFTSRGPAPVRAIACRLAGLRQAAPAYEPVSIDASHHP
jgi:O-antigen/teichoic acid export membrane protein